MIDSSLVNSISSGLEQLVLNTPDRMASLLNWYLNYSYDNFTIHSLVNNQGGLVIRDNGSYKTWSNDDFSGHSKVFIFRTYKTLKHSPKNKVLELIDDVKLFNKDLKPVVFQHSIPESADYSSKLQLGLMMDSVFLTDDLVIAYGVGDALKTAINLIYCDGLWVNRFRRMNNSLNDNWLISPAENKAIRGINANISFKPSKGHLAELSVNGLKGYPISGLDNINSLPYLERLKVEGEVDRVNNLSRTSGLKSLSSLELKSNKYFIKPVFDITSLKELEITGLDSKVSGFNLERLSNLINLEKLVIKDCGLTHLPFEISSLSNLLYLEINNTGLLYLPESVNKLSKLMVLSVNNNKLTGLPDLTIPLRVINIEGNPIDTEDSDVRAKLGYLADEYETKVVI